jgi:hypothetical protein
MKLGDRVTFARCHRLHRAETKACVGQSGTAIGRGNRGDWIVLMDNGITLTAADLWFDLVEGC